MLSKKEGCLKIESSDSILRQILMKKTVCGFLGVA
jgi:hypothetical protein